MKHKPKSLFVKTINYSPQKIDANLTDQTGGAGAVDFGIRWYKGNTDVSHDVQTVGHDFRLKPEHSRIFRARVKPQVMKPSSACLYPGVDAGGGQAYGVFFSLNNNPCD